ncbi:hypothetical protein [Curtobacterium sp. P97]|uniref:hypothetical protein n=1 Tax=Curtobacterium sp. P97 TaxID=2939562 RepID=UPI002040CF26|nr:hypothetical protein [Curtobacterium sp. P97]MCM3521753.1 hypothetical protein [Curtobacterium sp. P97]
MTDDRERWRITKENIYDRDLRRRVQHKAWHLYRGRKLIAKYRRWERAWEHLDAIHRKFPEVL